MNLDQNNSSPCFQVVSEWTTWTHFDYATQEGYESFQLHNIVCSEDVWTNHAAMMNLFKSKKRGLPVEFVPQEKVVETLEKKVQTIKSDSNMQRRQIKYYPYSSNQMHSRIIMNRSLEKFLGPKY